MWWCLRFSLSSILNTNSIHVTECQIKVYFEICFANVLLRHLGDCIWEINSISQKSRPNEIRNISAEVIIYSVDADSSTTTLLRVPVWVTHFIKFSCFTTSAGDFAKEKKEIKEEKTPEPWKMGHMLSSFRIETVIRVSALCRCVHVRSISIELIEIWSALATFPPDARVPLRRVQKSGLVEWSEPTRRTGRISRTGRSKILPVAME